MWLPVIRPLVRNQLVYLSKKQFNTVRTLLDEARHQLDTVLYYGRWQALLEIDTEADAARVVERPLEAPVEVEEIEDSYAAMAADGSDPQQESYAHLFVDSFGDLEALERTLADQPPAEEEEIEGTEVDEPLTEHEKGDLDAESGTTIPPVDQWVYENADVLNQDEYGFGLEHDIEDDDTRIFDEAGLQPDGCGMIPWDVVLKDPASKDVLVFSSLNLITRCSLEA
eukprot:4934012-Amphidinium_carterae.2